MLGVYNNDAPEKLRDLPSAAGFQLETAPNQLRCPVPMLRLALAAEH